MAFADWANGKKESPITDEDRLAYMAKLVERAFGREVGEVGEVRQGPNGPELVVNFGGKDHFLTYRRQAAGAVLWFVGDDPEPLVLGDQIRAPERLASRLSRYT